MDLECSCGQCVGVEGGVIVSSQCSDAMFRCVSADDGSGQGKRFSGGLHLSASK